jgi:hypothetical protein
MESVLLVYQRSYHHDFPFVCLDEAMKQLVLETISPISALGLVRAKNLIINTSEMEQLIYSWSVIRLKDGEL